MARSARDRGLAFGLPAVVYASAGIAFAAVVAEGVWAGDALLVGLGGGGAIGLGIVLRPRLSRRAIFVERIERRLSQAFRVARREEARTSDTLAGVYAEVRHARRTSSWDARPASAKLASSAADPFGEDAVRDTRLGTRTRRGGRQKQPSRLANDRSLAQLSLVVTTALRTALLDLEARKPPAELQVPHWALVRAMRTYTEQTERFYQLVQARDPGVGEGAEDLKGAARSVEACREMLRAAAFDGSE